jgi:cyclopropane-fatty-acyl-phospholipid synthase
MSTFISDQRRLDAARRIFEHLATVVDIPFSLRLWDGTMVPLGHDATEDRYFSISGPGVLGSLLRRPSPDNFFRHYVSGHIDVHGSDLIACLDIARTKKKQSNIRFGDLRKGFPWVRALPFLLTGDEQVQIEHQVEGAEAGRAQIKVDDKDLIRFHYDVGNAFYQLFLDERMIYTCAYFTDRRNSLDQAQRDKLEMICRKLRLQSGERFLDIGCGWGGLVCYAAENFGVEAHGVTLSQAQSDYAQAEIERRGLTDRVRVELKDYRDLTGQFDKIASIGMYEGIGIANYEAYFKKIDQLLDDRGIFLNHGITRRAKRKMDNFGKISPGKRVILKYIFPGSELDHIGHTLQVMESCGFEVYDVEGLRLHYARTLRLWHDRLAARREEAIALVGPERYRIWIAYLAGVTGGFAHGPQHLFQTVAAKRAGKATSPLPLTRDDLYRAAASQDHDRDAHSAASD